jgi:hypothetical protein
MKAKQPYMVLDAIADFRELTMLKIEAGTTGLLMIGGGVPKNFTQDTVVCAEILGHEDVEVHKYAVQITVADVRDGACSSSTLQEAASWGKVSTAMEQMVFAKRPPSAADRVRRLSPRPLAGPRQARLRQAVRLTFSTPPLWRGFFMQQRRGASRDGRASASKAREPRQRAPTTAPGRRGSPGAGAATPSPLRELLLERARKEVHLGPAHCVEKNGAVIVLRQGGRHPHGHLRPAEIRLRPFAGGSPQVHEKVLVQQRRQTLLDPEPLVSGERPGRERRHDPCAARRVHGKTVHRSAAACENADRVEPVPQHCFQMLSHRGVNQPRLL